MAVKDKNKPKTTKKKKITQSKASQKEGTRPGTKRMEKGKRSPTAHRTLEQAQKQSRTYEATPKRKKYRAALNKARKELGLKKGDGKEVSHKRAADDGGSHKRKNLTVATRKANRAKTQKNPRKRRTT
jgi:5-methylcytosine-specific restriction endonuclease McrA